jgi:hypothetical protein
MQKTFCADHSTGRNLFTYESRRTTAESCQLSTQMFAQSKLFGGKSFRKQTQKLGSDSDGEEHHSKFISPMS